MLAQELLPGSVGPTVTGIHELIAAGLPARLGLRWSGPRERRIRNDVFDNRVLQVVEGIQQLDALGVVDLRRCRSTRAQILTAESDELLDAGERALARPFFQGERSRHVQMGGHALTDQLHRLR